jgi:putative transposase
MGVEILSGAVARDHVHLLVSMPPQVSVSKLVQKLKGKSSYKLQREFPLLRKHYWGQRMWARGYIEGHKETEDQFRVVEAGDFESQ